MSIEAVEAHSDSARESAIGALLLAFSRDPVMRWIYPEPEAYLRHFPGFCEAFGGRAFDCRGAWASSDKGGAALWLRPGVDPDGEAIEAHFDATVASATLDTLGSILERMDVLHPHEPHWYLPIIGVDAAHQGKGLGGRLLQTALAECDAEHLPAYLESSNPANISLYERHGFEVVEEIRIGDAPVVTPMYRQPR